MEGTAAKRWEEWPRVHGPMGWDAEVIIMQMDPTQVDQL